MTENESIERLREEYMYMECYFAEHDCYPKEYDAEFQEEMAIAMKALKEIQQYREIGTVEECREAKERQRRKKPILDTIYHQQYYCPNCEDFLVRKNGNKPHHCICGQAIDWSDTP